MTTELIAFLVMVGVFLLGCFLCKLQAPLRFLCLIFRQMRLFLFGQVSVKGNQFAEPLRYGPPSYGMLFFVVMIREVKALAVVVNKSTFPIQGGV